jgi:predicted 3-demethylubiquinone-9 3-methyltransferase (glyoxalase superfamily)
MKYLQTPEEISLIINSTQVVGQSCGWLRDDFGLPGVWQVLGAGMLLNTMGDLFI